MAKKDRTGNRKTRDQRRNTRVPELGYYLIVTDTEGTESCYFDGLHSDLPKEIQDKLVVKVVETKTARLISVLNLRHMIHSTEIHGLSLIGIRSRILMR